HEVVVIRSHGATVRRGVALVPKEISRTEGLLRGIRPSERAISFVARGGTSDLTRQARSPTL
ncbi:hypothetical protein J7E68_00110, partial [Microbacterium sp. ISL-103]|nr:hypothetical protein [Microbacterium sp. ISL-103]